MSYLESVARSYLPELQSLAGDGQSGKMLANIPSRDALAVLHAAKFVDADGHITENGYAALDQIRRRHPNASPYVYYRPAPDGWDEVGFAAA